MPKPLSTLGSRELAEMNIQAIPAISIPLFQVFVSSQSPDVEYSR